MASSWLSEGGHVAERAGGEEDDEHGPLRCAPARAAAKGDGQGVPAEADAGVNHLDEPGERPCDAREATEADHPLRYLAPSWAFGMLGRPLVAASSSEVGAQAPPPVPPSCTGGQGTDP
jgi:hypothetical protein